MADSLSNKISGILNSAPITFDPEDDGDENTRARIEDDAHDVDTDDDLNISQFRKQNVELLGEADHRYSGVRTSRKSLLGNQDSESEGESSIDEYSKDKLIEETDLEEEEVTEESGSDLEDQDEDAHLDNDENTNLFNTINSDSVNQSNKSISVRQQLNIWENLLEMRIQMQKCLHASNKFPQTSCFKDLQSNSVEFCNKTKETKGHVQNLLDKLMQLQLLLLKKYSETKNILTKKETKIENQSDEEIPSDSDEGSNESENELDDGIPQKKLKLNDYKYEISKRFDSYRDYRNSVLQKWHDKTKIASNNSESVYSIIQQLNHVLNSKDKLIKSTQLIRTDYGIVGEKLESNKESGHTYNSNIFDDTDFYHHLLRELIEFKSADVTDPIKLSRQWVQLQNLRSKMKKKVDTKATKGRKIRYVVHPKLVNFMASVEDTTWQESAKTELYNSLFGKNRPCKVV
ncbi:hypothetical protein FQR65_LT10918 [Abscondita terminalis]|nr:hypothetical protein FQR65_LT10918 [Abscondita terminalis]